MKNLLLVVLVFTCCILASGETIKRDDIPDGITFTCPKYAPDVTSGATTIDCTLSMHWSAGISYWNAGAYLYIPDGVDNYLSVNTYESGWTNENRDPSITDIVQTVTFNLPQNEPEGNYTAEAWLQPLDAPLIMVVSWWVIRSAPTCSCDAGFTCNIDGACVDVDECQNANICMAGQECVNTPGNYTCNDIKYYITSKQTGYVLTANGMGSNVYMAPKNSTADQLWTFVPGKGGFITSARSGYVCDIKYGNPFAGCSVIVWSQNAQAYAQHQQWTYDSTSYKFVSKATGSYVFDVQYASTAAGTPVLIYYSKAADMANQQFTLNRATIAAASIGVDSSITGA